MDFPSILAFAIPLVVCFLFHCIPARIGGGRLGVDQWYWLQYMEAVHRQKKIPPDLPQYLLETKQWYPTLFPRLLTLIPEKLYKEKGLWLAAGLNLLRLLLLLMVIHFLTDGNSQFAVLAGGLIYATCPILIQYNIQLNPRVLGALFLDSLVVLLLFSGAPQESPFAWGALLLLSGLVLWIHKMSTQLFWFLCLGGAIVFGKPELILLIPASMAVAWTLTGGFYKNILIGHWDIVSFWNRNWKWLQAHPVLESPIYGKADYESPTRFYQKGLRGFLRHLKYFIGFFPGAWVLCAVFAGNFFEIERDVSQVQWTVGIWLILILVFALGTVFIRFMRCVGSGYYYLYNAAFPAGLLVGMMAEAETGFFNPVFGGIIFLHLIVLFLYFRGLSKKSGQPLEENFPKALEWLKQSPEGTVMCLPPQWYDQVASQTGKPVLYGGHGYSFRLLEPTFPRLLVSIDSLVEQYGVRYLLTQEGYLSETFTNKIPVQKINEFGSYKLFTLKSSEPGS